MTVKLRLRHLLIVLLGLVSGQVLGQEVDDLSQDGACKGAVAKVCQKITQGDGNLAECLVRQHQKEKRGEHEGSPIITEECQKEVSAYWIKAGASFKSNKRLQTKCKDDAKKVKCLDEDQFPQEGQVIACLRKRVEAVSEECRDQIMLLQAEAQEDYRVDPQLKQMCESDSLQFCSDVQEGEGRVQECLRSHLGKISWECRKELERQEAESSDDIRLSTTLYRACLPEKLKFCSEIPAGSGRVIQCLIDNKSKASFSDICAQQLIEVMQQRMEHLSMDPKMLNLCKEDIVQSCGVAEGNIDEEQHNILNCLQDLKQEISVACRDYVHSLQEQKFEDIRLDIPLLNACQEDRNTYCSEIPLGSARVIHCLQEQRSKLSQKCKATLFDEEQKMAEDIDFKYNLKKECAGEITRFCVNIPHGNGRVLRCLEDNVNHVEFTRECKKQVQKEIRLQSSDYRLNYRLRTSCESETSRLCSDVCKDDSQPCGGVVLQCLSQKMDEIQNEDCYNEIFYFVKMEVTDYRNDITLAEVCREDVQSFCNDAPPGEGRVHKCLRSHLSEISENCRKEELKLMQIQSRDVRLQPVLMKACQAEMYMYCLRISPGGGRMFKCLQKNLGQPEFGAECAREVESRSQLMQSDYRFDYGVKTHCAESVKNFCQSEASGIHQRAIVLNCLIKNFESIDDDCSIEVTRAVRMAFWTYKAGGAITGVCDSDVNTTCSSVADKHKKKAFGIGVVGRCLSRQIAQQGKFTNPDCKKLVSITAPKEIFDAFFATPSEQDSMIVEKLKVIEQKLGASSSTLVYSSDGQSAISSGGWILIGTMMAVIAVAIALVVLGFRNVFSKTIVIKNAAV